MADSTIDSELFHLIDNWPGAPIPFGSIPPGGFTGSSHHNVATAAFPVGTKWQVYNKSAGKPGLSIFIYLQVGTQNAASAIAAKSVVVPDSATHWYKVTNDPDDCIKLPTAVAAIALSAMTDAYFGWFWCGGVCPEEFVSALGGNYATDGNVAAGPIVAHDLAADKIGLGPATEQASSVVALEGIFGWAIAADAA